MTEGKMNPSARVKIPKQWTRRSVLLVLAGAGLSLPACEFGQLFSWNGGKPTLFGYATAPNYDKRIKTVKVNIFKDPTFWAAVPVPNLEMELTEFIIQQIEQKTPYKVVNCNADTELSGSILSFMKIAVNYNQLNEQRDVETTLTCQVVWKDLRTGQILSSPAGRNPEPPPPAGLLPGQQDPLNQPISPGSLLQMPTSAAPVSPGGNPAVMTETSPPPTAGNPVPGQTNMPGPSSGPPAPPLPGVTQPVLGVLVRSVAYYRPELGQSLATAQQDNCNLLAQQIVSMMETAW
jgi:hypothetical protein